MKIQLSILMIVVVSAQVPGALSRRSISSEAKTVGGARALQDLSPLEKLRQKLKELDEENLKKRFPYAVSLQDANRNHQCGAVLIRPRWILTAAQCVSPLVKKNLGPNRFIIKANDFGSKRSSRTSQKETFPSRTVVHPRFDGDPKNGYDIALVHLSRKSKIRHLRVPQSTLRIENGTEFYNLGWENGAKVNTAPNTVSASSIDLEACNDPDQGWNGQAKCGMLCASVPSDGFCRGEAGTPLMLTDSPLDLTKGNPSFDILVGISSFGEKSCRDNGKPAVFTMVSHFSDWIDETIRSIESGVPAQKKEESLLETRCRPSAMSTEVKTTPEPSGDSLDKSQVVVAPKPIPPMCKGGYDELNEELLTAARNGEAAWTKNVLAQGADVSFTDDDGESPLHEAAEKGHSAVVKILLDAGADLELKDDDGDTPLMEASSEGHADSTRILLAAGALLEARDKKGSTALIVASWRGHANDVRLLLDAGAQVDARNWFKSTSLMLASSSGHAAVVRLLLNAGASRALKSYKGKTALDLAKEKNQVDVIVLLT